ncbi:hypothetical protein DAPPUDRAFT_265845 [Daphnia pulex]|uniref:Uncharacterized protein n=1 Tax=Daphnia pulex TaxID=6669 RepID=E9HU36_DAPPU|nr:hypothetical protein DAPPUDRAFT_265845 [Daphnia pulex]|eukprot:EFX64733.1 hypothetical protein DAPPUDRAFT_265845 [Daphnia pulex]
MTSTPPTPPTAPIQIPLNQQQGPRAPSPDPSNVPLTKSHLRELYSQDERKINSSLQREKRRSAH